MTNTDSTIYDDIVACLGAPTQYPFNLKHFIGPNGGRINVLGLRYKGVIASGTVLRRLVEEHSGRTYKHWEFMSHMLDWCQEYTDTQEPLRFSKDGEIHRGVLTAKNIGTQFCIPPELDINIETLKETG